MKGHSCITRVSAAEAHGSGPWQALADLQAAAGLLAFDVRSVLCHLLCVCRDSVLQSMESRPMWTCRGFQTAVTLEMACCLQVWGTPEHEAHSFPLGHFRTEVCSVPSG